MYHYILGFTVAFEKSLMLLFCSQVTMATGTMMTIIVLEEHVYISLSPFLLLVIVITTYNNCYYYKSNVPIVKFPY